MAFHPEISVCIFSYNFGPYIEQAIESVLAQKLSVPYEIVIGDDKSTDGSDAIIKRYTGKYPQVIRAHFNEKNIGGTANWLQTISLCKGKYIAFLDGDDYFIDELKLQKQFDVLEADRAAVLCFHGVREVYDDPAMGKNEDIRFKKNRYNAGEILEKGWFIRTGSLFFRNGLLPAQMPDWVFNYPYRLDSILPVFLTMDGDAVYIDEICSVWRKHSRGMSYQLLEDQIQDAIVRINLAEDLDDHSSGKYAHNTGKRLSALYTGLFFAILRSGSIARHFNLFLRSLVRMDYTKAYRVVKGRSLELKKLDWDSEFFELPVYSLEVDSPVGKTELRGKLGNDDDSLLYVYLKDGNAELHHHLVSEGALFFDTRIIYAKELNQDNLCTSTVEIRDYKGSVDATIRKLAVQAGRYSRFHNDERLRPYFEGLYTAWIQNSISGAIADKVFVYEMDNAVFALATCVVKGGEGWTGLISVDSSCQGRGIGTSLMAAIERYFFENHIKRSLVITQEDNLRACKFYESCGYAIVRREFIYHWWI